VIEVDKALKKALKCVIVTSGIFYPPILLIFLVIIYKNIELSISAWTLYLLLVTVFLVVFRHYLDRLLKGSQKRYLLEIITMLLAWIVIISWFFSLMSLHILFGVAAGIITLGYFCNLMVFVLNKGRMPCVIESEDGKRIFIEDRGHFIVEKKEDAKLTLLADRENLYGGSIGDYLLATGLWLSFFLFLFL
jgi:hypothetical protein